MKGKKIKRKTHYQYDEIGELTGMTIHETITNPDCEEDVYIDDGELMTGEVEATADMSVWDIFLTAAAGALLGNLLYRVIKKKH